MVWNCGDPADWRGYSISSAPVEALATFMTWFVFWLTGCR
jgi:hypothetical protein